MRIFDKPWLYHYITDLPKSDSYTCVPVDRFSKACKLIPHPVLPTSKQNPELLFTHVFWNFGFLENIISNRGPQLISKVWRAFFHLLGVSLSLTSGYHPQFKNKTERYIQDIGRYLHSYCGSNQYAEFAQNSLLQYSTSFSSSAYSATSPPYFPGMESPRESQPWTTGSGRAKGCGTQHTSISSRQLGVGLGTETQYQYGTGTYVTGM